DPDDPETDRQSFAAWLTRHGQSAAAIGALWELIALPTLNVRAEQASLAQAAFVFQVGLLTDAAAADIGWAAVPLSQLHGDAAQTRLTEAGARVRTGVKVRSLERDGTRWRIGTVSSQMARWRGASHGAVTA